MFLACVIYPGGWDAEIVQRLCSSGSYDSGNCFLQWTYYLAIIAIFDAIVLAALAFVLAIKQVRLLPWQGNAKKLWLYFVLTATAMRQVFLKPCSLTCYLLSWR